MAFMVSAPQSNAARAPKPGTARAYKPAPTNSNFGSFRTGTDALPASNYGTIHTPTDALPAAKPPAPTPPPAPTGGTSGQASAPSVPDYLSAVQSDPQYLAQTAENSFKVNQQIGSLQQTLGFDETNLQAALAKLAYQQPRDQLATEQRANQRGSLYSSVYGQQQGNLAHQFAANQGGLTDNFARTKAGIDSRISGLAESVPLYNANALAAAIARAQKNLPPAPDVPKPPAPPGAPAGAAKPKPQGNLGPLQLNSFGGSKTYNSKGQETSFGGTKTYTDTRGKPSTPGKGKGKR